MAKQKAVNPNHLLKAWISPELKGRLYLHLHSDLEGRIPLGKISEFVSERTREFFEWESLDLSLHGGPQGYFVRGPKDMIEFLRQELNGRNRSSGAPGWGGADAKT